MSVNVNPGKKVARHAADAKDRYYKLNDKYEKKAKISTNSKKLDVLETRLENQEKLCEDICSLGRYL